MALTAHSVGCKAPLHCSASQLLPLSPHVEVIQGGLKPWVHSVARGRAQAAAALKPSTASAEPLRSDHLAHAYQLRPYMFEAWLRLGA